MVRSLAPVLLALLAVLPATPQPPDKVEPLKPGEKRVLRSFDPQFGKVTTITLEAGGPELREGSGVPVQVTPAADRAEAHPSAPLEIPPTGPRQSGHDA